MKFNKSLLASLVVLGLTGCSDSDEQDVSAPSLTNFTGVAIDGRVAGGMVWLDVDNDKVFDTIEPYAITDSEGYYTYNPNTDTNYCAEDIDESLAKHCLSSGMAQGDVVLRIAGGTDVSTGEPFIGVMSLSTNIEAIESNQTTPLPITPLTTLLSGASEEQQAAVFDALGVSDTTDVEALLTTDFTVSNDSDTDEQVEQKLELYKAALTLQRVSDALTAVMDAYVENQNELILGFDDDSGEPGFGSMAAFINEEIRTQIVENGLDITSNSFARTVLQGAVESVNSENVELERPQITLSSSSSFYTTASNVVQQINDTIETSIEDATTLEELEIGITTTQAVLTTVSNQSDGLASGSLSSTTALNNVASRVNDPSFIALLEQTQTDGETIDIQQLATDIEDGATSVDAINNATLAASPQSGESGIWARRVLSMSGQDDGERGRILFFFDGQDEAATQGNVTACFTFNGIGTSNDVSPTLLTGTWTEIGDQRGTIKINNNLVEFTVKAFRQEPIVDQQDIQSFVGFGNGANEGDYGHFRFVYDGDSEVWFSDFNVTNTDDVRDFGLVDMNGGIPTTSEECRAYQITPEYTLETNI